MYFFLLFNHLCLRLLKWFCFQIHHWEERKKKKKRFRMLLFLQSPFNFSVFLNNLYLFLFSQSCFVSLKFDFLIFASCSCCLFFFSFFYSFFSLQLLSNHFIFFVCLSLHQLPIFNFIITRCFLFSQSLTSTLQVLKMPGSYYLHFTFFQWQPWFFLLDSRILT